MLVQGYALEMSQVKKQCPEDSVPGTAFVQYVVQYAATLTIIDSDVHMNAFITEFDGGGGAFMAAAKDRQTLVNGLSVSKGHVTGMGSYALVVGDYGSGSFRWNKENLFGSNRKWNRLQERGSYALLLSTMGLRKSTECYTGIAFTRYIRAVGRIPLSQLAFTINGSSEVNFQGKFSKDSKLSKQGQEIANNEMVELRRLRLQQD